MQAAHRQHDSVTFPNGFLDFLTDGERRHRLGDYEIEPVRMQYFNEALYAISPESPPLNEDQIVTAGRRLLARHTEHGRSAFIASRLAAMTRLEGLVADDDWTPTTGLPESLGVLQRYRDSDDNLLPATLPVIGDLDDAVLVDVVLQRYRDELADYEDFCRFRDVAAAFAGVPVDETGLTREHWLEAMLQAHASQGRLDRDNRPYAPDPRATLFHIT